MNHCHRCNSDYEKPGSGRAEDAKFGVGFVAFRKVTVGAGDAQVVWPIRSAARQRDLVIHMVRIAKRFLTVEAKATLPYRYAANVGNSMRAVGVLLSSATALFDSLRAFWVGALPCCHARPLTGSLDRIGAPLTHVRGYVRGAFRRICAFPRSEFLGVLFSPLSYPGNGTDYAAAFAGGAQ